MANGMLPSRGKCTTVGFVDLTLSILCLALSFYFLIRVDIRGLKIEGISELEEKLILLGRIGWEMLSVLLAWKLLRQSTDPPEKLLNYSQWKMATIWCYLWMAACIFYILVLTVGCVLIAYYAPRLEENLYLFIVPIVIAICFVFVRIFAVVVVKKFISEVECLEVKADAPQA